VSQNQPRIPINLYRGLAAVGLALMVVGVLGGVFLKFMSEGAMVGTTLPGIILLLAAIRGIYGDQPDPRQS
jgi:small neutral amino acid transporter SnatA (MarC family)